MISLDGAIRIHVYRTFCDRKRCGMSAQIDVKPPALSVWYGIVTGRGWWQGSGKTDLWGSPFSALLFASPVDAIGEVDGLGYEFHVATVVIDSVTCNKPQNQFHGR